MWERAAQFAAQNAFVRYGAAAALVGITVAFRLVFDPVFRPSVYYHLYYPAVILSAYILGARAGIFAALLAGGIGYWFFSNPIFQFKIDVPFFTFLGSSSVAIYVFSHVRDRLTFLTGEYKRIDQLMASQAELFREHAERVSNHMQLISALLQLQAGEAKTPMMTRALQNASSRSMIISRMHRAFANREDQVIDFQAFAARLTESALAAQERPPLSVIVEGDRLYLPLEQATSLGLVLLECVNARAATKKPGILAVELSAAGDKYVLRVVERGPHAKPALTKDAVVLAAVAEQMRGSLIVAADQQAATIQLSFPSDVMPSPKWEPMERFH